MSKSTQAQPGAPADKQINIRVTEEMRDYWQRAADAIGKSQSEFIRDSIQSAAIEILECFHPIEFRKIYPWSETCLKCGKRLRDGDKINK